MLALTITPWTVILIGILVFAVVVFVKTIRIVPQKQAFIIERLGKYSTTLEAGFHILMPFVDRVSYRHTLKEQAVDVPPQQCITKDNIAVEVDGILYMQVGRSQEGILRHRQLSLRRDATGPDHHA